MEFPYSCQRFVYDLVKHFIEAMMIMLKVLIIVSLYVTCSKHTKRSKHLSYGDKGTSGGDVWKG